MQNMEKEMESGKKLRRNQVKAITLINFKNYLNGYISKEDLLNEELGFIFVTELPENKT